MQYPSLQKLLPNRNNTPLTASTTCHFPEKNRYQHIVHGYHAFEHNSPFLLDHGAVLPRFQLAYETWGSLNHDRSNAILLHTGLSATSHAKSTSANQNPGWWESMIGPGRYIDTNQFFVICTNVLGGCYGSTGPSSVDIADGKPYATQFPIITTFDIVRAQFLLLDHLGIRQLWASIGHSMGGMQSLAAAVLFPDRVKRLVTGSACAKSHPYSIAIRRAQRQAIMNDPCWNKGHYYDSNSYPYAGMKLAREIATISYRSGTEWGTRFGQDRAYNDDDNQNLSLSNPEFLIETYLEHQGNRFKDRYDPNSLLYLSKAMDTFDLSSSAMDKLKQKRHASLQKLMQVQEYHRIYQVTNPKRVAEACRLMGGYQSSVTTRRHCNNTQRPIPLQRQMAHEEDLIQGLSAIQMPTLVVGVETDNLFLVEQQKEIANCLTKAGNCLVNYLHLDSIYGHDTFLIDIDTIGKAIQTHLNKSL
ncbi:MAG: homoserine O-acetyltransferase [Benjaminiella poitrasii]|nr:MAG: homoserine O-acetyltransferase [Benjaminiella poitrasii]